MKILVTGHKGFIGSHLVEALTGRHQIVGQDWPMDGFDIYSIRPDRIVNLAATLHGHGAFGDIRVCQIVAGYASEFDVPTFHSSSIVCAEPKHEPWCYGWRKAQQERIMSGMVARFHNVYGPGQPRPSLFGEMCWSDGTETPLTIRGGEQIRSFVYVGDVVARILGWVEKPIVGNEVWSGVPMTVSRFVLSMELLHRMNCRSVIDDNADHGPDSPFSSDRSWTNVVVSNKLW